jgi:hypothetical protein
MDEADVTEHVDAAMQMNAMLAQSTSTNIMKMKRFPLTIASKATAAAGMAEDLVAESTDRDKVVEADCSGH